MFLAWSLILSYGMKFGFAEKQFFRLRKLVFFAHVWAASIPPKIHMWVGLGTLISHPTPPLVQLRPYFRGERSIESVLRLYFKGERRVCSSSCTPASTSMCTSVRVPFLVCACQGTLISRNTPPHPWFSCASNLEEKGALNPCCAFILQETESLQ